MANDEIEVSLRVSRDVAAHMQLVKNKVAIAILERWLRDYEMQSLFDLSDETGDGT